jgi:hypothetical protein
VFPSRHSHRKWCRTRLTPAEAGGAHPQNYIAAVVVLRTVCILKSRPRIISTGLLHVLPRFHIRPINQVVYLDPYSLEGMGGFISRLASRLDAFSGYPIQT